LKSAWLQPFDLSNEKLLSNCACKCNLYRYAEVTREMRETRVRRDRERSEAKLRREVELRQAASSTAYDVIHDCVRRALTIVGRDAKRIAQMKAADERRSQREEENRAMRAEVDAVRARAAAVAKAQAIAAAAAAAAAAEAEAAEKGEEEGGVSVDGVDGGKRDLAAELEAEAAATELARVEALEAERAAVIIQSRARARSSKKNVGKLKQENAELDAAAVKIQASVKGRQAREALPRKRKEKEDRQSAVVTLQARFRGAATRKRTAETMRGRQEVSAMFMRAAVGLLHVEVS
jgi:hypothetical protein